MEGQIQIPIQIAHWARHEKGAQGMNPSLQRAQSFIHFIDNLMAAAVEILKLGMFSNLSGNKKLRQD